MPFFKQYEGYKAERKLPPPTRTELLTKLGTIKSVKHKAFFTFLYLLGARIEEIVGLPAKEYQPVMKYQFEEKVSSEGKEMIVVRNVRTLKTKKGSDFRHIPISKETEKDFLAILLPYVQEVPNDKPLFNYSRTYSWQLAKHYFGQEWFPHWFRHTRATHLASEYNFTTNDLVQYFGWKDVNRTLTYVHLNWDNLAKKMG